MLRLLPAFAFLASMLCPAYAQTSGRDEPAHETDGIQVGYLLSSELFTRPSVLAVSAGPISRDNRVRVVPYPERRGWFEVYSLSGARLLGYAYQPYVSRFGPDGPEGSPLADADLVPTAAVRDEPRPASIPVPPPPGRQLPEVTFSASPAAAGVRCTVRLWSNVRRGPGLDYEAFGVIRPGVPFQVQTMQEGWGKVQLEEQAAGYVSHTLLGCVPAAVAPASVAPVPIAAVTFPHSGELALPAAPDAPASLKADVESATHEVTQESALRALLTAAGIDPETAVYLAPTDPRFHRETCEHLPKGSHPLPLAEAMMNHPPCAHCVPLTLPAHDAPRDQ